MQGKAIHTALKKLIRSKGKTYADVAEVLDLSENSVKRLFSNGDLSLKRMETLCNWIGMDIKEVVLEAEQQQPYLTQLTLEQEKEFVDSPRLLLVTFLVLNNWKEHEIKTAFDYDDAELNQHFAMLERIGFIELLPYNRIRLLTARNFKWNEKGPVRELLGRLLMPEFIKSDFLKPGEKMHLVGGMLSEHSIHKAHEKLDEIMRYFDHLLQEDMKLPANKRYPVAMLLGFRLFMFAKVLGIEYKLPIEEIYDLNALGMNSDN